MSDTQNSSKNIIYLDHDAEITEAIEQLKATEGDSVRLVVPGRSGLLQSVVNLKLLKRAADSKNKDLILVTTDKTATALAGKLEIAVAKNISASPHIVAGEPEPLKSPLIKDDEPAQPKAEADTPIQRYEPSSTPAKSRSAKKRGKVPDYKKFQLWIWGGAGLILLILFGWIATAFLQTATVHVQATADRQAVNTNFILSTSQNGTTTVVAKSLETSKDLTQAYQASGQKDVGSKASGSVAVKNCEDTDSHPLAAGTQLTTGGKVFVTSAAVTIPGGDFSGGGAICKSSTVSVAVTAAQNGDSYNFSGATFSLAGFTARFTASGTTSGGVTKNITVVSQADIDAAQKAALEGAKSQAVNDLKDKATDKQKVFEDTVSSSIVSATPSVPADTEAASGSLTLKVKFVVLAADRTDLETIVKTALQDKLVKGGTVLDAGLDEAIYNQTKALNASFTYSLTTTAFTGQPIDKITLAKDVAGKAKKDVPDIARKYPNVSGATIDGWALVPNMPVSTNNIKIDIIVSK